MKRSRHKSIPRLIRRRERGQSIQLIALILLIVVAAVGLSVDVGNTFAEEREAVSAANAGAIAGMNAYLDRTGATTNASVYSAIENTLKVNGISPEDVQRQVTATYLDGEGSPLSDGAVITAGDGGQVPANVAFVEVKIKGKVDTFFARVVNRPDLPINATAYAGKCPTGSGVYPLGVDIDLISGNEFIDPATPVGQPQVWWRVEGGQYDGFTKRRIYVHTGDAPGGFSWLQWLPNGNRDTATGASAGSARELEAAMGGIGTLGYGYQEVEPWPNAGLPEPDGYPEKRGEINPGDWVHGNSGFSGSNGVDAVLDGHIANQTQLVLPIYDVVAGGGANAAYHVVRLGLFVLTDHGKIQGKPYIDLIFLGDATRQETACLATPPPPTNDTYELAGAVQFEPLYPSNPDGHEPIQYVVVFDVSGSMNMNFDGQGIRGGQVVQCTNGPPGSPPNQDCGEPQFAWNVVGERRITVAKKAIEQLVRMTNMPNNPNYRDDLPKDTMALVWFNEASPTTWSRGFRDNPQAIINDVMTANAQAGDNFKSRGGTNAAAGLYRASQLLQNAPRETEQLNQTWQYKRVVVFLTDGVSNYFINPQAGDLKGVRSDQNTYAVGHSCRSLGLRVLEDALCQTTDFGERHNGMDRPITQAVNVSTDEIKTNSAVDGEVFVLALSNIPDTGLKDGVATSHFHFFGIPDLTPNAQTGRNGVEDAMIKINDYTNNDVCQPRNDPWRDYIPSSEFVSVAGLTYPNVGEVIIKETSTNTVLKAPIIAGTNGTLTYRFVDLPRGSYQMSAYLYHKHPLEDPDEDPRQYSPIYRNNQIQSQISVLVDGSNDPVDLQLKPSSRNVCSDSEE